MIKVDLRILQNAKEFLDRADLKGKEVPLFNEVIMFLAQVAEDCQQSAEEIKDDDTND